MNHSRGMLKSTDILILLLVIVQTFTFVASTCTLHEETSSPVCVASLNCDGNTDNLNNLIESWQCIRYEEQYIDYSNYRRVNRIRIAYHTNYKLRIIITNPEDSDLYSKLVDKKENIIELIIDKGDQTVVSEKFLELSLLEKINLSGNLIDSINLHVFTKFEQLNSVNLSNNVITDLKAYAGVEYTKLINLDLSHNRIESLEDNYFSKFSNLQYLDLSFNLLKSLDILTFEGVSKLETLYLTNNKLVDIGLSLCRFFDLKKLYLDHNSLSELSESNFRTTTKLEELNLNYNLLNIKNTTKPFHRLVKLKKLYLDNNYLSTIPVDMLSSNSELEYLSLSNNIIETIELGAFSKNKINTFNFDGNKLKGPLDRNLFKGFTLKPLSKFNLSGGHITHLNDYAFAEINGNLTNLNLSTNSIMSISENAFVFLNNLVTLDLSNNYLQYLKFNSSDLKNLTWLSTRNNSITHISNDTFQYLEKLKYLDLSNNKFVQIDTQMFTKLNMLETLEFTNSLSGSLFADFFKGVQKVKSLDISLSKISALQNNTFSGLNSLKSINSSHCELNVVQYETFKNTSSIEVLDLSYNVLTSFNVDTSTITLVTEIYLNNNRINNITKDTFLNLIHLQKLHLANNDIFTFDAKSLEFSKRLYFLDLTNNNNINLHGSTFENLTSLSHVILKHTDSTISFRNFANITINNIDLSLNEIKNISSVSVYNIKNLQKLDMSRNKITEINKPSFREMSYLGYLDLSHNLIDFIQPGSFLHTDKITHLNLNDNDLSTLQYGTFDGLKNLDVLNLSNNAIHHFTIDLLHSNHFVSNVGLENNNIKEINLYSFVNNDNLKLLSVGGNQLSCEYLVELKTGYSNFTQKIKAERSNFDSQNVEGITCITRSMQNNTEVLSDFNKQDTINYSKLLSNIEILIGYYNKSLSILNRTSLPSAPSNISNVSESKVLYEDSFKIVQVFSFVLICQGVLFILVIVLIAFALLKRRKQHNYYVNAIEME